MEMKVFVEKIDIILDDALINIFSGDETEDIDEILDNRDDIVFDEKWVTENKKVENIKDQTETDKSLIDEVRKGVYLKVYRKSKSPDLAAYISDDFELILDAFSCQFNSPWINALLNEYVNGRIPQGNLKEIEGSLEDIILNRKD